MYGRLGLPLFFCGKRSAVKKGLLFCLILMLGCSGLEPDKFEFDNLAVGNPGHADVVIDRHGFAVGFCNEKRQALWVIYKLEAAELKATVSIARIVFALIRKFRLQRSPQIILKSDMTGATLLLPPIWRLAFKQ